MSNRLRNQRRSNKKPTINDIAQSLGVSKTTVSRAISGKGRISTFTRDRVLACIEEKGFRPHHIAKSLAESRTFNIGLVLPSDTDVHQIPFFQNCMHSISATLSPHDYDVLLTVTERDCIKNLERLVYKRKVDGIILTRLMTDDKAAAFLQSAGVPFVVIGSSHDSRMVQIDSDHSEGCRELTAHMLDTCQDTYALLAGDSEHQVNKDRYLGFLKAFGDRGLHPAEDRVFWNLDTAEKLNVLLPQLLSTKINFLLCMDDVICARTLQWARINNIKIPQDLRMLSFYDSSVMELHHPPITALHVDVEQTACLAAETLLDLIKGCEIQSVQHVAYTVCIRESSRI